MKAHKPSVPRWLALVLGATLLALSSCDGGQRGPEGSSETHFLVSCDTDAGSSCVAGFVCLCGVCTQPCADTATCGRLATTAQCTQVASRSAEASCPGAAAPAFCDAPCGSDADCTALGSASRCSHGFCRSPATTPVDDAGGDGAVASDSNDGAVAPDGNDGPNACRSDATGTSSVVLLGDAFIANGHQITADLEQLARASGSLLATDHYRDYASSFNCSLAGAPGGIATQYLNASQAGAVSVVIMDGGGADILGGLCPDPPTSDCQAIKDAVSGAQALLPQMAQGGVTEVVYFFYPDPIDTAVKAKVDLLRPLLQDVCSKSALPCHWLDLRPVFAGHYADYVLPDGLNPTTTGAQAAAAAIWSLMQQSCVAQ